MEVHLPAEAMIRPFASGIAIPVIVPKRCMDILTGDGPSPTALMVTSLLPGVPTRQCVYGIEVRGVVLQCCKGIAVWSDHWLFIQRGVYWLSGVTTTGYGYGLS